jgi:hypothetical protein
MPTASVPNPVSVDETWGDAIAASASSDDLVVTDALAKATYLSTDTDMDTLGRCVQALASPVPAVREVSVYFRRFLRRFWV